MVKFTAAILLPVLAHGAAINLEPRQAAGALIGSTSNQISQLIGLLSNPLAVYMVGKKKAYKIENLAPTTGVAGAKRVKLIYGPYTLKAANSSVKVGNGLSMDKGGTAYQAFVDDDFPKDVMVLETHSELVNANFKRADIADGIYNHHNVFFEANDPGTAWGCEGGKGQKQLPISVLAAGATEDGILRYLSESNEVKAGFYLRKDRKILAMIDVVNYNNEERQVYTVTEFEYLEGKPQGYLRASQQRVDPGICGGEDGGAIRPPHGQSKFQVKSQGIVAAADGWVLNARGHMHDGGVNIQFKVNGKEACDSRAVYGGQGHESVGADGKVWKTIRESTYCPTPFKIKKGDKIEMQANYDLDLHPARDQGHGSMMRTVADTSTALDGGDTAEQMALVITHFAFED